MLSVVIPAFNEESVIPMTAAKISEVLDGAGIEFELVFVNDGSSDGTWNVITGLSESDSRVRGVCFSRNFGKEAAMLAGLESAQGDCCVVMDCDLQNPPETIPKMYELWQQGYEIIEGVKKSRGRENAGYNLMSRLFYKLISASTGFDMSRASDFKLLDRKAVLVLLNIRERNMFFRAMSTWIGFKTAEVEFDVQERAQGTTKWSKKKLIGYAITNITSFTTAPMQIVLFLGILMLIMAILFGAEALYRWAVGQALGGFTTVILLQLIIGSFTMISLGVIGYYIARIFDEVRLRPKYIVSEYAGRTAADTAGKE